MKKEQLLRSILRGFLTRPIAIMSLIFLAMIPARAATVVIYTNDFEAYTDVATNLADEADADPDGPEWNLVDDNAIDPVTAGAGVQVINWLAHSGTKSLLMRNGNTQSQIFFTNAKSGSSYQLDFWLYVVKSPGDRNFIFTLRAEGADNNGDNSNGDYVAYRSDRAVTDKLFYYDGIGPDTAAWIDTGISVIENQWQHHRIIVDANARKMTLYVDDMVNPVVVQGDLARPDSAVPTVLRLVHEGNSGDDGYFAIDDISMTVDGSINLDSTYTDGFENYPARTSDMDDANPQGPWITVESDGNGGGKVLAPNKVQVVDSSVVAPHSGNKCLKLEYGQRAGASIAWGQTPQSDVQITWWAYVPEAMANNPSPDAVYLRMSLYGTEGGNTIAGDSALMGYGIRNGSPVVGDGTSILYYTTAWVDTGIDYTPVTWEQYRLTTHVSQGTYTIVKNPSSADPEVIVDRGPFIGAAPSYGPMFMAAWSSSNGTNHPPVYIDDIEIKSLVSNAEPLPEPYTVTNYGTRFTNVTILKVGGSPGGVVVDPRDNSSILFTVDSTTGGGIFRAHKVSSGNWAVDPVPVVPGLSQPSGIAMETNGTIWWTHDYTMALDRLKAPWESNSPEEIISNFGAEATDDDPIDVTIAPPTFNGTLGQPGMVVVADRGEDGDASNAALLVDPTTTLLGQTGYVNYLVMPTGSGLGGGNLNAITSLPESGEVVTLSLDGYIAAIDGNGTVRNIVPGVLWTDFIFGDGPAPSAQALAVDPITGKIWVADDVRDEIWSIDPNPATQNAAPDQKEAAFPLVDTDRTELQIDVHDPGMAFAPNGAFMVVSDTSTQNGGGRLIIFHNEEIAPPGFNVTGIVRNGNEVQLTWESAGDVTYRVQRSTDLGNPNGFQDISGDLNTTQFTDTNAGSSTAFYRIVIKP